MICKNCGRESDENYCPACGQKMGIGRLNFRSMIHNVILGVFNSDKGIFFTIKELYTRPGYMIRDYLEGKRVRYFAPFQMLFVLAAVYVVLYGLLGLVQFDEKKFYRADINEYMGQGIAWVVNWMQKYIAFVWLLMVPLSGCLFRWICGKRFRHTYNWAETFFIVAYIQAQQAVISVISLFFFYFYRRITFARGGQIAAFDVIRAGEGVQYILVLITVLLSAWTFRQLNGGSWFRNIGNMLIVNLLFYLFVVIFWFIFFTVAIMQHLGF